MIDVSVIIVTWNSEAYVERCLESLARCHDGCSYELIAVDNGSADGTVAALRREPGVHCIETGSNLGFPRAVNIGLRAARGRHVLLLNPDAELCGGALGTLVRFLDAHPEAGCAGPRLLDGEGRSDPFAARALPSLITTALRQLWLRALLPEHPFFGRETHADVGGDEPRVVPGLIGAALLIPRALLDALGGLDEQLPMYLEDLDLCARLAAAGRPCWFVPAAEVVHFGGRSTALSPARRALHALENGEAPRAFLARHRGAVHARLFTALVCVGSLYRLALLGPAIAMTALLGRPSLATLRELAREARILLDWSLRRAGRGADHPALGFTPRDAAAGPAAQAEAPFSLPSRRTASA